MNAVKGGALTDAACGVLAITPDERERLNNALAGLREEFAAWAGASLRREATNGDTLARFTIPANVELAASLSNKLASAVMTTLGQERADLLQRYSRDWYQIEVGGLASLASTLTISRRAEGGGAPRFHYDFSVKDETGQTRRGQSGLIMPNSRYFPAPFKSIFPGGWRELAEREGFELPYEG